MALADATDSCAKPLSGYVSHLMPRHRGALKAVLYHVKAVTCYVAIVFSSDGPTNVQIDHLFAPDTGHKALMP